MFNSLYHAEIGGGYTLRRKIIINAADPGRSNRCGRPD